MKNRLPTISLWILQRFLREYNATPALGDLEEEFNILLTEKGESAARCWFRRQAIKSIPSCLYHILYWRCVMLNNYLKIALRNLLRHKSFSIINISGLAIGIAVSMLILVYIVNELTYDRHIGNVKNKYRVCSRVSIQGEEFAVGQAVAPLGPTLLQDFPKVKNATRTYITFPFISYKDRLFYEEKVYYADPSFFDLFSVRFVRGAGEKTLEAPFSLVITEEMAEKYFGDEDPIGKILTWNNEDAYTVTGIVHKLPDNTHFQFNMLASFSTLYRIPMQGPPLDRWIGYNYRTYIELAEGASASDLEAKFPALLMTNTDPMIEQLGIKVELFLQPLTSIYLYSRLEADDPGGSVTHITIFSAIALFILLIACINFMNLSTARSLNRMREVGIRKVMGAQRRRLIAQFLGESVLLSVLSLCIALVLMRALLPVFNGLISKNLHFNLIENWPLTLGLLLLTVAVGILAGSYPAFYLSSFHPLRMFKGSPRGGTGNRIFRNTLVNIQFLISIVLICCTGVIYTQLNFVKSKNLGFDKQQLLVVRLQGQGAQSNHGVFKSALAALPGVVSAAASSSYPGRGTNETYFYFEGMTEVEKPVMLFMEVDYDYLRTMGMEIVAGRNFSEEYPGDESAILLNETLVQQLNWDDAIGKTVDMTVVVDGQAVSRRHQVIGVIRDFHFASLHEKIRPHLMRLTGEVNYMSVRIRAENITGTVAAIGEEWRKIEPSRPFNYFFLDEEFDRMYRSEQKLGQLFVYFTVMAIFIACLGLFGLASFTAEQRTKEIGIRKVLGASMSHIVLLLFRDVVRWAFIANIVAWPIAYLAMNKWLQNFAYTIDLGIWVFLSAGLLVLTIALLTVSYQSLRAAHADPVESLRYE